MKKLIAAAFIALALVACASTCPPVESAASAKTPGCDGGAPFPPPSPTAPTCNSACANMRYHECPLGKPTPRGVTCERVCENTLENTGGVGFPVKCLTNATSCKEGDACR